MRILAIDGDPRALDLLTACLRQACPQGELHPFSSGHKALAWLKATGAGFDAAFLEVALPEMSGVALARQLQARCPRGNLIFVTEFPQYMGEAFDLHASGYLMKPVTVPELPSGSWPICATPSRRRPLCCGCRHLGTSRCFSKGGRCTSAAAGAKELFAYLIDRRGAGSTMGELISILWEGRLDTPGVRSQLRSLITDLRTTLQALGQEAVIIKRRDLIAVDPKQVDCDYYRFLAGAPGPGNLFRGEYMSNYSWGETTLGALTGEDP